MTPKDASLFARYHRYICRYLSSSFAPALQRMVHVLSENEPFQALDRGLPFFYCGDLDIFHVPIGLFLFQAICYSTSRNSSKSLPCSNSSYLLGSVSCCIFIALIVTYRSSGGVLVAICRLSMGVVEYALYILRRTALCTDKAFLRIRTFLYSSANIWIAYVIMLRNMVLQYALNFLGWILYGLFASINILFSCVFAFSKDVFICLIKLSFSSKMTPRYLVSSFTGRVVVPSFMTGFLFSVFPNTIAYVLVGDIVILYLWHQL